MGREKLTAARKQVTETLLSRAEHSKDLTFSKACWQTGDHSNLAFELKRDISRVSRLLW